MFTDVADLSSATFTDMASFSSATFTDVADFSYTTFTDVAEFHGATFTDMADFSYTTFYEAGISTALISANLKTSTSEAPNSIENTVMRRTSTRGARYQSHRIMTGCRQGRNGQS